MSAGLDKILQAAAGFLNDKGIPAVTAWPAAPRQEREGPVAVVSLRGCKVESSGLQNYLGERYDRDTGHWVERFGKKAQLTLGLDIYAPDRGGDAMIQSAFDALAGALLLGGPQGMELVEFSCGQTLRDGENRRLKRPVEAVFSTYLWTAGGEGGQFTDFELRGVVQQ